MATFELATRAPILGVRDVSEKRAFYFTMDLYANLITGLKLTSYKLNQH